MTRRLVALITLVASSFALARPACADMLGWLNSRVDRLLADGENKNDAEAQPFDRYLKLLAAPGDTGPPTSVSAPAEPYRQRLTDALRETIPDGGDRDTAFFYQNLYLLGMLSAQLGFRTPFRVVGHLGEGIDPGILLLEKIQAEVAKDPGRMTVMRLHQLIERAMVQVQSTHQLMVESRDVLEAARNQLSRTCEMGDRMIAEEGRLQSIPAVLGVSQTGRKGVDNLAAAMNALHSCTTHFRSAFHAMKAELADLEELSALSAISADRVTMAERRDRVRVLDANLNCALSAMREAAVVVRTDLALIRLNHQGLMQVLTTLSASPLSRQRRDDGGLPGADLEDRERASGVAFAKVNPRLAEAVGLLAALGRDMEVRRTRLEEWAKGLKAWKPDPVTVEELPEWAFSQNTLPGRDRKWTGLSLLPEGEQEVNGLIETLERDLKIGPSREESDRSQRERRKLDEKLGDDGPDGPIDRPVPVGAVPLLIPSPLQPAPSPAPSPGYELPSWF